MNTNRYESPKARAPKAQELGTVGPAWWGLAIGATFAFILAIWFLTHSAT